MLASEVLAGPEGTIRRQIDVKTHPYTEALKGDIKGMKIGLVTRVSAQPNAEAAVNAKVKAAAKKFETLGATVGEVSIPLHFVAGRCGCRSARKASPDHDVGRWLRRQRPDLYVTSLMDFHRNWRSRANEMSETTKAVHHAGNLHPALLRQPLLRQGDESDSPADGRLRRGPWRLRLLMMPTTPIKATPLPPPDASRELQVERALDMISNTAPFDITTTPPWRCPRHGGRPAGFADAGRQALRGADNLQGGLRVRGRRATGRRSSAPARSLSNSFGLADKPLN